MRANATPRWAFEVLGLSASASAEEIKRRYKKLAFQYHPDRGGDATKFLRVTEARDACLLYKEIGQYTPDPSEPRSAGSQGYPSGIDWDEVFRAAKQAADEGYYEDEDMVRVMEIVVPWTSCYAAYFLSLKLFSGVSSFPARVLLSMSMGVGAGVLSRAAVDFIAKKIKEDRRRKRRTRKAAA